MIATRLATTLVIPVPRLLGFNERIIINQFSHNSYLNVATVRAHRLPKSPGPYKASHALQRLFIAIADFGQGEGQKQATHNQASGEQKTMQSGYIRCDFRLVPRCVTVNERK